MKKVTFDKSAMDKMRVGLDKTANAVSGTIGPRGRNVFIGDQMTPKVTNDGHTIASQISFPDKLEELGSYVVRNTSGQQNDDVGDGTTTVTVLLQSIIHEALKRPENPMQIRTSLNEAGKKLLKILAKKSIKINKADILKVALISAENEELAKLITEIINKLGEKAIINVEDSKTFATDYEVVDGYEAHVGFMSPHFITDKKTARAVYSDIPVLVTEKKISNISDIAPLFEQFKKAGIGQCVIVCEDIDDAMLGVFVVNKNMGQFNALVIRATGPLLLDIEGATGAKAISNNNGITFASVKLEHLGKAKKIVCDANKTLFLGNKESAHRHALNLEKQADNEANMFVAKKLRERVAKLRGGVAVLRIGAPTDLEREYLKFKAEDSVKAVQAALAEGVVEGGGMTLWRIASDMKPKTIGEEILKKALTAPLRKIIENAGKDYAEIIRNLGQKEGYDAKEDKYVDMIKAGIIDPTKVERCALENAISNAGSFITTFCVISDYVEPKD